MGRPCNKALSTALSMNFGKHVGPGEQKDTTDIEEILKTIDEDKRWTEYHNAVIDAKSQLYERIARWYDELSWQFNISSLIKPPWRDVGVP